MTTNPAPAHVRWTPRPKTPCRKPADIRGRLSAGARTIIVDVDQLLELDDVDQLLELDDADFAVASAKQAWTMRITGVSQVRINLTEKLPKRITIVATDASSVQVTGFVEIHAYSNATVDAFDDCKVAGHNNATINACDRVEVNATENTTVNAYDTAEVHATGQAVVNASGRTRVVLLDEATATTERGVTVLGPGRHNITIRS